MVRGEPPISPLKMLVSGFRRNPKRWNLPQLVTRFLIVTRQMNQGSIGAAHAHGLHGELFSKENRPLPINETLQHLPNPSLLPNISR